MFSYFISDSDFLLLIQCGGGCCCGRETGEGIRSGGEGVDDAKLNLKMYTPPPWLVLFIVGIGEEAEIYSPLETA